MNGINTWFIIEIFSFYGYILGAIIYIFINICKSSCGLQENKNIADRNEEYDDYIMYHRKELDWAAFVQILFNVNIGLIIIDRFILYQDRTGNDLSENFPLLAI